MSLTLTSLLTKAAVASGKRELKKLVEETPFSRAIRVTADAFPMIDGLTDVLQRWCQSNSFNELVDGLKGGTREVTDDHIIKTFIAETDFYMDEETSNYAEKILIGFAESLTKELLKMPDGLVFHGAREEVLHSRTHQGIERITQLLENLQNSASIIREFENISEKQWRPIETLKYGVITEGEASRMRFALSLGKAMEKVFANRKYLKFNGLLQLQEVTRDGIPLSAYVLFCHQVEFCEEVRRDRSELLIELMSASSERKAELQQIDEQKTSNFLTKWRLEYKLTFAPQFTPVEFVYDSATHRITMTTRDVLPIEAENYPNKVRTTSEMLQLLAPILSSPFLAVDDMEWVLDHYPTMKLLIDLLDRHEIDLGRLQVNVSNYEEWDYINPTLDRELEAYKAKR